MSIGSKDAELTCAGAFLAHINDRDVLSLPRTLHLCDLLQESSSHSRILGQC